MGLLSPLLTPLSGKREHERVALQFSENRVQLIKINGQRDGRISLSLCLTLPFSSRQKNPLLESVRHHHLKQTATSIVLSEKSYHLFPSDPPDLPREEWSAAMRWQIQDHIDRPASEMVVEVFDVPTPAASRKSGLIYVAATPEIPLKQWSRATVQSRLHLTDITIPELALKALAARLPEQSEGLALLKLDRSGGMLLVIRKQTLYLAREITLSSSLQQEEERELSSASQDEVALEVRRTLDYFESTFDLPSVAALYLIPSTNPLPDLENALNERLNVSVKRFDIRQAIQVSDSLADSELQISLTTIGAALSASPLWRSPTTAETDSGLDPW
ncbi:MAG: hypothetical protein HQL67_08415 [Magnetococcales bacterium]|nr:hypothetical protein [Magnetococcales bacterium]